MPHRFENSDRSGHPANDVVAQAPSIFDKWRLVDLFLEYKGLVTQHIESSTTN
jgi:hypothetical protein